MQENLGPSHHNIANLLIDKRISDMTKYLMEDYNYSLEKALDTVYKSQTMSILQEEDAELYVQSSAYVYDMLINELGLYPVYEQQGAGMVAEDIHS